MKKYFYSLLVASIFSCSAAIGQTFKLMDTTGLITENGGTYTVTGTVSSPLLTAKLWVINTGGSTLTVKVRRDSLSYVNGTSNYFCWTKCYAPTVNLSPTGLPMTPSDTLKSTFYADYQPYGIAGTTSMIYVFFDQANPNDSSWVKVKFVVTLLGTSQLSSNPQYISAPYPCPSGSYASFNYHVNTNGLLTIYNSIGQSVKEVVLSPSANKANLNVADMPPGIYICKLSAEGSEPTFQKLVVAH